MSAGYVTPMFRRFAPSVLGDASTREGEGGNASLPLTDGGRARPQRRRLRLDISNPSSPPTRTAAVVVGDPRSGTPPTSLTAPSTHSKGK